MPGVNTSVYFLLSRITALICPTQGRKTMIRMGLVMPVTTMMMMTVFLMTG